MPTWRQQEQMRAFQANGEALPRHSLRVFAEGLQVRVHEALDLPVVEPQRQDLLELLPVGLAKPGGIPGHLEAGCGGWHNGELVRLWPARNEDVATDAQQRVHQLV